MAGVELLSSAPEKERHSPAYDEALSVINDGIEKSNEDGFSEIKVFVNEKWKLIGEYGLFDLGRQLQDKAITLDEYNTLIGVIYNAEPRHQGETVDEEPVGCECPCGQCENGGGIHCHRKALGCYR